ncbi:hypothetical protein G7046_g6613 [Stylonectria norvegica]|nr:hypothetical protein G7046_g6613 [Stylonectria norvegica]
MGWRPAIKVHLIEVLRAFLTLPEKVISGIDITEALLPKAISDPAGFSEESEGYLEELRQLSHTELTYIALALWLYSRIALLIYYLLISLINLVARALFWIASPTPLGLLLQIPSLARFQHVSRAGYHAVVESPSIVLNGITYLVAGLTVLLVVYQVLSSIWKIIPSVAPPTFPPTLEPVEPVITKARCIVKPADASYVRVTSKARDYANRHVETIRRDLANTELGPLRRSSPTNANLCGRQADECKARAREVQDLQDINHPWADKIVNENVELQEAQRIMKEEMEHLKLEMRTISARNRTLEEELQRKETEHDDLQRSVGPQASHNAKDLRVRLTSYEETLKTLEAEKGVLQAQVKAEEAKVKASRRRRIELAHESMANRNELIRLYEVQLTGMKRKLCAKETELAEIPMMRERLAHEGEKAARAQEQHAHAMTRFRGAEERRAIVYDRAVVAEGKVRALRAEMEKLKQRQGKDDGTEEKQQKQRNGRNDEDIRDCEKKKQNGRKDEDTQDND